MCVCACARVCVHAGKKRIAVKMVYYNKATRVFVDKDLPSLRAAQLPSPTVIKSPMMAESLGDFSSLAVAVRFLATDL